MAIPTTWSKQSQRLRYNTERGWEIVQTWRGPNGANSATRLEWLAEQSGYTTVEFDEQLPQSDGDCVCVASITFASNQNGDTELTPGAEYGLLNRSWSLLGSDEQLPLESHANVAALQTALESWPQLVRNYVDSFRKQTKDAIEAWGFTPNSSPALPVWNLPQPSGTSSTLQGYAELYSGLLLATDNPTYDQTRYVLRKTETVTSWSTMFVSHTNVGRWLSWSSLVASEPTLSSTGLIQTSGLTDYIWLKKSPEVTVASNGTRELSQEFFGGVRPPAGSTALSQLVFVFGAIV